jgi:hypothetical protein
LFDYFQAVEAASHTEVAHLMVAEAQGGPNQCPQDGAQVAQEAMAQVAQEDTDQVAMVNLPNFSDRLHQWIVCILKEDLRDGHQAEAQLTAVLALTAQVDQDQAGGKLAKVLPSFNSSLLH